MNKKIIFIGVGSALLVLSGITVMPYLAVNDLKGAIEAKNADKVISYINFPELQVSVKETIKNQLITEATKLGQTTEIEPQLAKFDIIVSPVVDQVVSPQGIKTLFSPDGRSPLGNQDLSKSIADADFQMGYRSLNRFDVNIIEKNFPDKQIDLQFTRDGFRWQLSGINLK
jgi:hypothetical protein